MRRTPVVGSIALSCWRDVGSVGRSLSPSWQGRPGGATGPLVIDSVVAFILDLVRDHGPLILFLAAFVETAAFVGLAVPGEALLAAGGYLVQRGQIAPEVAWVCVYLGALAGDHVAYALGRSGGRRLLRRLPLPGAIYRVERLIERYGGYVILGGRFLGGIRAVLMLTVGAMGVPYRRFWLF